MRVYSMVTNQGTAMPETGYCENHPEYRDAAYSEGTRADDIGSDLTFHDVSLNERVYCNVCGLNGYGESDSEEY